MRKSGTADVRPAEPVAEQGEAVDLRPAAFDESGLGSQRRHVAGDQHAADLDRIAREVPWPRRGSPRVPLCSSA